MTGSPNTPCLPTSATRFDLTHEDNCSTILDLALTIAVSLNCSLDEMSLSLSTLPGDIWTQILPLLSTNDLKDLIDAGNPHLTNTLRRTVKIVQISTASHIIDVTKHVKWALQFSKLKSLSISSDRELIAFACWPLDLTELMSNELTSLSLSFEYCPQYLLPRFDFSTRLPNLTELSLSGQSAALKLSSAKLPRGLRSLTLNTIQSSIIVTPRSIQDLPDSLSYLSIRGISGMSLPTAYEWPSSLRHLTLKGAVINIAQLPHGLNTLILEFSHLTSSPGAREKFPWRSWFPRLTELCIDYSLFEDNIETITNPLALYQHPEFLPLLDFIKSDELHILSFLAARRDFNFDNASNDNDTSPLGPLAPHKDDAYATYQRLKLRIPNIAVGSRTSLSSLRTCEIELLPLEIVPYLPQLTTVSLGSNDLSSYNVLPQSLTALKCYSAGISVLTPSLRSLSCHRFKDVPSPITSTNFVCQSLTSLISQVAINEEWAHALPTSLEILACGFEATNRGCNSSWAILVSRLKRLREFKIKSSSGFPSSPLAPFASQQLDTFTLSRPLSKTLVEWLKCLFGDNSAGRVFPESLKSTKLSTISESVPLSVLAALPSSLTEIRISCGYLTTDHVPGFPLSQLSPPDIMHRLPPKLVSLDVSLRKKTDSVSIDMASISGWPRSLERVLFAGDIMLETGKPFKNPKTELALLEPHLPPNLVYLRCRASNNASSHLKRRKTLLTEDKID